MNDPRIAKAQKLAADQGLKVSIVSLADINFNGTCIYNDPSVKLIEVAAANGPNSPNPGLTFSAWFNSQSDADQYVIKVKKDECVPLFDPPAKLVRDGREVTRLLYIDHSDRDVLAEGAARLEDSDDDN